jgi:hypothetical protein
MLSFLLGVRPEIHKYLVNLKVRNINKWWGDYLHNTWKYHLENKLWSSGLF